MLFTAGNLRKKTSQHLDIISQAVYILLLVSFLSFSFFSNRKSWLFQVNYLGARLNVVRATKLTWFPRFSSCFQVSVYILTWIGHDRFISHVLQFIFHY
jgi:hypothetical protein